MAKKLFIFLSILSICLFINCFTPDADNDGVADEDDNCIDVANPDQKNSDWLDQYGDACDNCPFVINPFQLDLNHNGIGDACEPEEEDQDADEDGIKDDVDNCPNDYNPDQGDSDHDGMGNACDACPNDAANDADGDGVCGNVDNCPTMANPDQTDSDGDGKGDVCDTDCADADSDDVCDVDDNCPNDANTNQADADVDGIGDVCDECPNDAQNDIDNDGLCADEDPCPTDPTNNCGTTELSAPQNVKASDAVGQTSPNTDTKGSGNHWDQTEIRITWNAVSGATYYKVYRCDDANCATGTYNLISGNVTGTSYSDVATVTYTQTYTGTGAPYYTNASYTLTKTGIDWGKVSPVQPAGAMGGDKAVKIPRTYSYKVKAFNASQESEFSAADAGNRIPAHAEVRNEMITPEGLVFLNRLFCCNNDPYLNDHMYFDGDVSGTAEMWIEGGTSPVTNHQRFYNYSNMILVQTAGVDGALDTSGTGWVTGTIKYSGYVAAEMDYMISYIDKWADSGLYTIRYEGVQTGYYHPKAQSATKPTQSNCTSFGIPYGADYDVLEGDCM